MDIVRTRQSSRWKRPTAIASGIVALIIVSIAFVRSADGAPVLDRTQLLVDTVRRGDLTRDVRGAGTLVPEHTRWLTALASARVERIIAQNGQPIRAGEVLLELSNPDLQVQTLQATQAVRRAQSDLLALRASLESARLSQQATVASLKTQLVTAAQESRAADTLVKNRLISPFEANTKRATFTEITERLKIEESRLALMTNTSRAQIEAQEDQIRQLQMIGQNQERRMASLTVRAPEDGVVQDLSLQPGQWIPEGTVLAKVIGPRSLRANLRLPESQARDVLIGMRATIDVRHGTVSGRVSRKDAAAQNGTIAVDVTFDEQPAGAVPDLGIDGVIHIERVPNVLVVGRPTNEGNALSVFRIDADGSRATRVPVSFGRTSANSVEVVRGLHAGDLVILSDMSAYNGADHVRLK